MSGEFQFSNIIGNLEKPIFRDIGILPLFPKGFQFAMKYVEIVKIALNPWEEKSPGRMENFMEQDTEDTTIFLARENGRNP